MRSLVCSLALLTLVPAATAATPGMLFPVVGGASYTDDFGAARAQGAHEGNDLLAAKRTPVIAVEDGTVRLQHSHRGGFMLYLESARHEYLYIHLNNDRHGDDGRGGTATAYAPGLRNGMHVRAGQEIAYVGDSGDAEDVMPHLHFEYHTPGGRAVDPFPHLRAAPVVAFSALAGRSVAPTLRGRLAWTAVASGGAWRVAVRLRSVQVAGRPAIMLRRLVVLRVSAALGARLRAVRHGTGIRVVTASILPTPAAQILAPGVLIARAVVVAR